MISATEQLHPESEGFDARPMIEAASILAEAQIAASEVIRTALAPICSGACAMANTIRSGGVLHYVAAGSSGLMAAADAMELGGTYSIPARRIQIHMAGGLPTGAEMPGETEDDTSSLAQDLSEVNARDTVIAVSASGTTPYTVAGVRIARDRQAQIIGIANNAGSELLKLADHAITLSTPPEVVAGSTRMGAGTAQKIALNMLSTLMAVDLGHVYDGMMVNLRADNMKLSERARGIVSRASHRSPQIAEAALAEAGGDVKLAVVIAAGAVSAERAASLLQTSAGHLRPALQGLT